MPTDPTLILVTTTDALPREGGVDLLEELKRLRTLLYKENADLTNQVNDLRAEVAQRDDAIADKDQWIAASHENLARLANSLHERDLTIQDQAETNFQQANTAKGLETELAKEKKQHHETHRIGFFHQERAEKAEQEVLSLRAQLARAGAIEEAARAVVDSRFPIRGDAAEVCGLKFQALERALASPGPRGTPEEERLANLESVASAAKAYVATDTDSEEKYRLLVFALKELEATQCPSP